MKVGVFDSVGGSVERYHPYCERYPELELIPFRLQHPRDCLSRMKELGIEAILFTGFDREPPELFEALADAGIRYIATISVGHEHLDPEAMARCGIRGANVPRYSPNSVAEYTVMMLLACMRRLRQQIRMADRGEYGLSFPKSRELRDMTVGVIGAGRIGSVTIECLTGFHPKQIYAYTRHPSDRWRPAAEYAPLEKIYAECDAILYHTELNPETTHLINAESIAKMKDGVILVNPSRGGVADTEALLTGIESGKIGALGLDVIEREKELKAAPKFERCPLPLLEQLLTHENVIFTAHSAYYTDIAEQELMQTTIDNLAEYARTGHCANELTALG